MVENQYTSLQKLVKKYGEETVRFSKSVHDLGGKIVCSFDEYLGGPDSTVSAVPPEGKFEVGGCYNDAAFDSYDRRLILLEPIRMGLCTEIRYPSGGGATWVRTVLRFSPYSGGVRIEVGVRNRQFHVANDLDAVMPEICEAILSDVREAFSLDLDEAQGHSRIGFI